MRRRQFIAGLAGTIALPRTSHAQKASRIYRLGHLAATSETEALTRQITLPELARHGFVEGRNLIFDARVGESDSMPALMRELLAAQPDAVVAIGTALKPAATATRTVPVVAFGNDPVVLGLAASYARPGSNVTGVVIAADELEAKRLSILLETVPNRRRIAALIPALSGASEIVRKAAAGLGIEVLVFPVAAPSEYPAAFAAMRAQGAEALIISALPQFLRDGRQLAGLALEARLATVCEWAEMARMGCLIGYGPNRIELRKRMADQIAQIFRGVAPGDIPIERPTSFEFALNLKIAKSLDLIVPPSVLTRADEVIE
ncbi:ABC transporter substrate-binding protein [Bradyrhizobium liaoningense]|uniref:ABC transporter substrate-binding protein n=1 Tax=Bradyrhizobium liaoningense TaxID=43992 RepID=UPI001BA48A4E|nr:ABC transporter substrate-binding protein [Bradyrhizobium liaoningense]MBR0846104.1 ABC transporter substrate-binding protein [Bradyrhizobium liaoningense]